MNELNQYIFIDRERTQHMKVVVLTFISGGSCCGQPVHNGLKKFKNGGGNVKTRRYTG